MEIQLNASKLCLELAFYYSECNMSASLFKSNSHYFHELFWTCGWCLFMLGLFSTVWFVFGWSFTTVPNLGDAQGMSGPLF